MSTSTYRRNTEAARRRTEARIEEAQIARAESRRQHAAWGADPAAEFDRRAAVFPGFPPLLPAYETPPETPQSVRWWAHRKVLRLLARTRDAVYGTARA